MTLKIISFLSWIIALIIVLNPGNGFCELKPLSDAELSDIKATGVSAYTVKPQTAAKKNNGALSGPVSNSGQVDTNSVDTESNTYKIPLAIDISIPSPQYQFRYPSSCRSSR